MPELALRGPFDWFPRFVTAKTSASEAVSKSDSVVAIEDEEALIDVTLDPVDAKYLSASVASSRRAVAVVPVFVV